MSSKYTAFRNYSLVQGNNIAESLKNNTLQVLNSTFEDSPFFKMIKFNDIDIPCRVESTNKYNTKKLLFKVDNINKIGDIVEFDNKKWLIISYWMDEIMPKAIVAECNIILKWQDDKSGLIYEYPCVATRPSIRLGEKETKGITLLEGQLHLSVPNDEIINNVSPGKRFYVINQTYEVVGFDAISAIGIMQFTVNLDVKHPDDNDEYKICNYQDISIEITDIIEEIVDGELIKKLQMSNNSTQTLQWDIRRNTEVIENPGFNIIWKSSDEGIAIIEDGEIISMGLGQCDVIVELELMDGVVISDTVQVMVQDIIGDNFVITIDGDYEVPYGNNSKYTAIVTNNGQITNEPVDWFVKNRDGTITDKCHIVSFTDNSCLVQNDKSGYAMVGAKLRNYNEVIQTKNIWCKGVI